MAGSINKVILVGNVGRDPEIRSMSDGKEIANLSIATSDTWRDKATGERREKTEWHRVVVFSDGLVNLIKNYIKKGSKLYIEGQLQTRKWTDNDNNDRYTTEIVLQNYNSTLTMLDNRGDGNMNNNMSHNSPTPQNQASSSASSMNNFDNKDIDDEIPW